jgi:hypothetical protein
VRDSTRLVNLSNKNKQCNDFATMAQRLQRKRYDCKAREMQARLVRVIKPTKNARRSDIDFIFSIIVS